MSKFDMGWGDVKEPGTGGNVDFMKLQAGQNQMRIVGRPSLIEIHWEKAVDGTTKKVICPGAGCPVCKAGHVPMQRYQVKVIDRIDGKVKVLEGGTTIFNAVKSYAMDPDYGDPTKYDIKLKKEGSGRETKYTVIPAPKRSEISAEQLKAIEDSKSLEEINKPKTIEEIMQMGLEILVDSIGDLDSSNDESTNSASNSGDVSDDDWDNI